MITYEWLDKIGHKQAVYLEGKRVGTIKKVSETPEYQYFPKGSKTGGDTFLSVWACKDSLTGDE